MVIQVLECVSLSKKEQPEFHLWGWKNDFLSTLLGSWLKLSATSHHLKYHLQTKTKKDLGIGWEHMRVGCYADLSSGPVH